MANEQQIEALEQAKKLAQEKVSEIESALQKVKSDAQKKLDEIDKALADAMAMSREQATLAMSVVESQKSSEVEVMAITEPIAVSKAEEPEEAPVAKAEEPEEIPVVETAESQEKPPIKQHNTKHIEKAKPDTKKKGHEAAKVTTKTKNTEKEKINKLQKSIDNRTKGKYPAEDGNKGVKHTDSEVFVYVIDDNALQLKVMVEKFKNTKSFKKAKGFESGTACLEYLKTHRYPKKSMIMVVVDFYLEPSANDPEEPVTGIDVLTQLKEYDSDIEVIILSASDDVDISASATRFGALSFIKKGDDDFKKIVNNIVWAIYEKQKLRNKAETQDMVKKIGIIMAVVFTIIGILYYFNILDKLRFL